MQSLRAIIERVSQREQILGRCVNVQYKGWWRYTRGDWSPVLIGERRSRWPCTLTTDFYLKLLVVYWYGSCSTGTSEWFQGTHRTNSGEKHKGLAKCEKVSRYATTLGTLRGMHKRDGWEIVPEGSLYESVPDFTIEIIVQTTHPHTVYTNY